MAHGGWLWFVTHYYGQRYIASRIGDARGSCTGGHASRRLFVSGWTHGLASTHTVPPHDLEQARMVRQPELLGRLRDVPLVSLECLDHDLSLRLRLSLDERSGLVRGGALAT